MLTKIGGLRPEFELLRCFSVCRFGTCVRVGCCRNCVSTRHPSPRWSFIRTNFFWHPARRIVVFCFGTWRTSASSPTRNRRPTESGTADGVASFFPVVSPWIYRSSNCTRAHRNPWAPADRFTSTRKANVYSAPLRTASASTDGNRVGLSTAYRYLGVAFKTWPLQPTNWYVYTLLTSLTVKIAQ